MKDNNPVEEVTLKEFESLAIPEDSNEAKESPPEENEQYMVYEDTSYYPNGAFFKTEEEANNDFESKRRSLDWGDEVFLCKVIKKAKHDEQMRKR